MLLLSYLKDNTLKSAIVEATSLPRANAIATTADVMPPTWVFIDCLVCTTNNITSNDATIVVEAWQYQSKSLCDKFLR